MKFFILVVCAISGILAENYCDPTLCTSMGQTNPHIACPGVARNECPSGASSVTIDNALKTLILKKHNTYRNDLAGGKVGFATAAAMTEMTWDDELAMLASKNAMQCIWEHDKCHNTRKVPVSGQNMGMRWGSAKVTDFQAFASDQIDAWWSEKVNCTQQILDTYPYPYKGPTIGHFTVMAADLNNVVGCAISDYVKGGSFINQIVCNYGYTNMGRQPIYKKGGIKSQCKDPNSNYANLCKT